MEPPRQPPAWAITVRLRSSGLDLRMAAANVLPGWGRGGERLSLLLRLRRRLRLAITSECSRPPGAPPHIPIVKTKKPHKSKLLRFLGRPFAFIKWRKKKVAGVWSSKDASSSWQLRAAHWLRTQALLVWGHMIWLCHERRWMICFIVLASIPIFRFMFGYPRANCIPWAYWLGKHNGKFLAPLLYEWIPKFNLLELWRSYNLKLAK